MFREGGPCCGPPARLHPASSPTRPFRVFAARLVCKHLVQLDPIQLPNRALVDAAYPGVYNCIRLSIAPCCAAGFRGALES